MLPPKVSLSVRNGSARTRILDIRGEMTAAAEGDLMSAYAQAGQVGVGAIILNISGLEYMNSSGIGLLVTLLIRVNRRTPRQRLLACGLNEHYRQIFALTRLDEAIALYATEAEALAAAG